MGEGGVCVSVWGGDILWPVQTDSRNNPLKEAFDSSAGLSLAPSAHEQGERQQLSAFTLRGPVSLFVSDVRIRKG